MATISDDLDPELLQEFLTEANEKVVEMDLAFLALEKAPGSREIVENIFRQIHTIKGNSGFFGFTILESLAHHGESLLSDIRNGKLAPNDTIISLLLECEDGLKRIISNLTSLRTEGEETYEDLKTRLEEARNLKPAQAVVQIQAVEAPGPAAVPPILTQSPSLELPEVSGAADLSPTRPMKSTSDQGAPSPREASDTTIRVAVKLIEGLMNQVGELVLCRNQILQYFEAKDLESLEAATQTLDHLTSQIQENMMKTRLQPIGNVFNRFPRIVRDLAKSTGKSIDVHIDGQTTEIDKTLIEAIADPLTHIIRNAVDHGVEPPSLRESAGKSRTGNVQLRAHHEGGQVIITISDDGRGMDPAKLIKKAVEKGILDPAEASRMSSRQALQLIFASGFSTAEAVTNISGRGVGMDVVKRSVERVNGRIDIDSVIGRGSTFKLQIPLTLAIIPALIVDVASLHFAIPQVNLVELVYLEGQEIHSQVKALKGRKVIRVRDELVPIVSLRELLRLPEAPPASDPDEAKLYIVVVKNGSQLFGLVVDRSVDTEEIVVKPLTSRIKRIGCYAGTTIMGDGHVALILDIPGIMRMMHIDDRDTSTQESTETQKDIQNFLICSSVAEELFAVPLVLISRIEEIPCEDIIKLGNREAINYWDTLVPIVSLHKHIDASPIERKEVVTLLVFEMADKRAAIEVGNVHDSVEYANEIDSSAFVQDGILGSMIVEGKGVRLIDVFRVLEMSDPEMFRRKAKSTLKKAPADTRLLLVEDSSFYRNLVSSYLTAEGFQVTVAIDGEEGFAKLADGTFDMVITDLEMPNLDGFGLAQRIRHDSRLSHLPILCVTSLDSESDRAKASKAGINAFQTKLNRCELLDAIEAMLPAQPPPVPGART